MWLWLCYLSISTAATECSYLNVNVWGHLDSECLDGVWCVCNYPAVSAQGSWRTGCSCEPVRWDRVCGRSCRWGRRPVALASAAAAWPAGTALPTSLQRTQQDNIACMHIHSITRFILIDSKKNMIPPGLYMSVHASSMCLNQLMSFIVLIVVKL